MNVLFYFHNAHTSTLWLQRRPRNLYFLEKKSVVQNNFFLTSKSQGGLGCGAPQQKKNNSFCTSYNSFTYISRYIFSVHGIMFYLSCLTGSKLYFDHENNLPFIEDVYFAEGYRPTCCYWTSIGT